MEITSESLRGTRVIAVAGDMDLSSVDDFQTHLEAAFAEGAHLIVIDIEHVPFLDSSVLHALVRALRKARRAGGDIAIVCVDPGIRRMLEVFGLSGDLKVCHSVSQATAALTGK